MRLARWLELICAAIVMLAGVGFAGVGWLREAVAAVLLECVILAIWVASVITDRLEAPHVPTATIADADLDEGPRYYGGR